MTGCSDTAGITATDHPANTILRPRLASLLREYPGLNVEITKVRVEGQTTFNGVYQMLHAAASGCGLAFVPEELALPHVEAGRLVRVMEDWDESAAGARTGSVAAPGIDQATARGRRGRAWQRAECRPSESGAA